MAVAGGAREGKEGGRRGRGKISSELHNRGAPTRSYCPRGAVGAGGRQHVGRRKKMVKKKKVFGHSSTTQTDLKKRRYKLTFGKH